MKHEIINDVKVITMPNLLEHLFGANNKRSTEEEAIKVAKWFQQNDAYSYHRDEDECFFNEAVKLAKLDGKSTVVVECT